MYNVNGEWCQKIIKIGILVTIIFEPGVREKIINQRVYLKKFRNIYFKNLEFLIIEKTTFTIIDTQIVKSWYSEK